MQLFFPLFNTIVVMETRELALNTIKKTPIFSKYVENIIILTNLQNEKLYHFYGNFKLSKKEIF